MYRPQRVDEKNDIVRLDMFTPKVRSLECQKMAPFI